MLRARSLVAVWQEQRQTRGRPPLGEPGDDELVDDDLRPVDEVAVLRLPQHQRLGRGGGVAVLEAQAGVLGERAVVQLEAGPRVREMLDRDVDLACLRIVEGQLALAEGAPHRVLPGQPDRVTLEQERAERQSLRMRPFDVPLRIAERGQAAVELPGQLRIDGEAGGRGQQGGVHCSKRSGIDGGDRLRRLVGGDRLLAAVEQRFSVPAANLGLTPREVVGDRGRPAICLLGRDDACIDQAGPIHLAHAWMGGDRLVHLWLRVGGLVPLVVAVAPVADQVDHHIAVELRAVHPGKSCGGEAGFRIVRVDVDDRRVEPLGQVAGIDRRASLAGLGGEADLIVGNQVQGAARGVAGQSGHVERLRHDALGGEGSIAMDQDRDRPIRIVGRLGAGPIRLLCSGVALDHRVHGLEVARVGREGDAKLRAVRGGVRSIRAEVVLDVVENALRGASIRPSAAGLELRKDRLVADSHDVSQHVQTPAMRHAEDDVACPRSARPRKQLVEHGDHGIQPLDAEAFLPEIGLVQEALEALHQGQPLQQGAPLSGRQGGPMLAGFDHAP